MDPGSLAAASPVPPHAEAVTVTAASTAINLRLSRLRPCKARALLFVVLFMRILLVLVCAGGFDGVDG
jgi:hypothetical protein